MKNKYQRTLQACYLGLITQAISANFAPLLFLTFHKTWEIPFGKIALISTVFYFTQLVIDIFCVKAVDRIGYRKCAVASEIFSSIGLILLAFLPSLLPDPFVGILISVIIYATGSGLIEVLCSPIVEACPFPNKESVMSLLHSFYCWGSVGVIVLSTLFFSDFGIANWHILSCLWAILPLYNTYNFLICPIEHLVEDGKGLSARQLLRLPMFWISILLMICAGASELTMSQWASAYAESALGLTKSLGDLIGPCLFAATMAISRTFYGKYGEKINLMRYMIFSGILCLLCYLATSVSNNSLIGLLGCIICGFSVGVMWPGTISISSKKIPTGGTAMFALLAMAGDMGGSVGPGLIGFVTQNSGNNLRHGLLVGSIFPTILILSVLALNRMKIKTN